MGRIILARHGECLDNQLRVFNGTLDSVLSPTGVTQAKDLACAMRTNFSISHIFSSPKRRAVETANICREHCSVAYLLTLDYIRERNHGILEGEPYSRVRELAEGWLTYDDFDHVTRAKGAETYEDLHERARQVYHQMLWEVVNLPRYHRDVLFIGHGVLFRMIWAIHHGLGVEGCIRDHWKNCEYRVLEKPR